MRDITHNPTHNGHPLSYSSKNDQGFYTEILRRIESLLEDMTQRHGSVFFIMLGLKYPSATYSQYPNDNALLSRFLEALTCHCKRRNYDPRYLWARERSTTGQVHYHLMILLNADYTQNAHGLLDKATKLWQRCLDIEDGSGLVQLCEPNKVDGRFGGVKIRRNDPHVQEVWDGCFQWASYLAKCYSKGNSPRGANEFGCSRLA